MHVLLLNHTGALTSNLTMAPPLSRPYLVPRHRRPSSARVLHGVMALSRSAALHADPQAQQEGWGAAFGLEPLGGPWPQVDVAARPADPRDEMASLDMLLVMCRWVVMVWGGGADAGGGGGVGAGGWWWTCCW